MNLSEIRQEVRSRLGDTDSSGRFSDAMLNAWINQGYLDACAKAEWPVAQSQTTTEAGRRQYQLPVDFMKLLRLFYEGEELAPVDFREIRTLDGCRGWPCHYFVFGDTVGLDPIPAEPGQLTLWYVRRPTKLGNDLDEPEFPEAYHDVLATYACYRARQNEGNQVEAQAFLAEYIQRVGELRGDVHNRVRDQFAVVRDLDW